MPRLVPFALAALLATSAFAQTPQFSDPANLGGERVAPRTGRELPIDSGALGLEQLLRKLNTRASILNIVAHPDDEDGGMLTLYARGFGARVADLSFTRGEGGQNAMTGDFEDALGLLRTQELLANDRYTGVTQMFGTEVDFGFSKTKSESFAKWPRERVLYDAVRAIRIYRPLVITATFIGNPTDGHGQHQVSGEIAQEAFFIAAGDPNVFPELTKEGILPWKPLKMYARVPRGAISSKGLFDYATNQNVPAEFTNYITHVTTTTPPSTDIVVHEGKPDPLLTIAAANHADLPPSLAAENPSTNLSYVQFARLGLGLQKSQIGPGVRTASSGSFNVDYHLYGSRLCGTTASLKDCHPSRSGGSASSHESNPTEDPSFFDGIDTGIEGIASLAPDATPAIQLVLKANLHFIEQKVAEAQSNLNLDHQHQVAPDLADALQNVDMLLNNLEALNPDILTIDQRASLLHELHIKRVQLNDALTLALGLNLEATTHNANQIASNAIPVWLDLREASPTTLNLLDEHLENSRGNETKPLDLDEHKSTLTNDHSITRSIKAEIDITGTITRPYFTHSSIEDSVYTLTDPILRNAPATPPALTAWAKVDYKNVSIELGRVVHDSAQPVSIVPAGSILLSQHAQVFPSSESVVKFSSTIEPIQKPVLTPKITTPHGWSTKLTNSDTNAVGRTTLQLTAPAQAERKPTTISASATLPDKETIHEGYFAVGYGDLPRTNYFTPAIDRIVPVDLQLPSKRRIAYLPGTGDAVPEALASIGLPVITLTIADLTSAKLASFDTIILGVRTYNAHPDLHGAPTQALLDFARNGGNVVVQYQTQEFTSADAPYPLDLGSDEKVVDETAPVTRLKTQDALLTTPNVITPADFNNWIEERGHGFMSTWDAHYTALTETHDPGSPSEHVAPQLPQRGGLLTCTVGKGHWTYVAFALYRQLPEAVPGAYRLFLNLLDNPR